MDWCAYLENEGCVITNLMVKYLILTTQYLVITKMHHAKLSCVCFLYLKRNLENGRERIKTKINEQQMLLILFTKEKIFLTLKSGKLHKIPAVF